MAFLKNLFKRKPGGTFVGNLIRGAANKFSGGLLGNGAMMIKPDETPQQADTRLIKSVGSGVAAFDNMASQSVRTDEVTQTVTEKLKSGAETQKKPALALIVGGVVGGLAVIFLLFKTLFKRK